MRALRPLPDLPLAPPEPRISDLRIDAMADVIAQELVQQDECLSLEHPRTSYTLQDEVALKIYEDDGDELVFLVELLAKIYCIDGEPALIKNAEASLQKQLQKIGRLATEKLDAVSKQIAERELGA